MYTISGKGDHSQENIMNHMTESLPKKRCIKNTNWWLTGVHFPSPRLAVGWLPAWRSPLLSQVTFSEINRLNTGKQNIQSMFHSPSFYPNRNQSTVDIAICVCIQANRQTAYDQACVQSRRRKPSYRRQLAMQVMCVKRSIASSEANCTRYRMTEITWIIWGKCLKF